MLLVWAVKKFSRSRSQISAPNQIWGDLGVCLKQAQLKLRFLTCFHRFQQTNLRFFPKKRLVGTNFAWDETHPPGGAKPERNPDAPKIPCSFGQEEHWGFGPWHFCGIWRVPDFQWHVPAEHQSLFFETLDTGGSHHKDRNVTQFGSVWHMEMNHGWKA